MNVELPSEVNDFVQQLLVAGRFASEQEATVEAFRLLKSREQLRADIARGFRQLDDGEWIDGKSLFDELDRDIDAIEEAQRGG